MENTGMVAPEDRADLDEARAALQQMKQDAADAPAETPDTGASADQIARRVRGEAEPEAEPIAVVAENDRPRETEPPLLASVDLSKEREVVRMADLDEYRGQTLRVVLNDGTEFTARYIDQDASELEFERKISAGTFAVYMPKDSIRSMHPPRKH